MSSFYGGKQGRTYHIVQRYDSVADMVNAFSGGGAYTDANYGQYVIIDTVLTQGRSASRENGLLYRRGFDYNDSGYGEQPVKTASMTDEEFYQEWKKWVQNPGAGAIYVGQIVGPEGRTPELEIEPWQTFVTQQANDGNFGSTSSVIMDPTATGKQRDTVQVGYINIVDAHGDITGGYIAFDIPELVVEAEVVDHDAYSTAGVIETPASTAHPFWYKWDFTVPDGKRGQDIEEIKIETGEQTGEEQDGFGDSIVSNDQYFTYSVRDYQESAAGAITAHLGRWPYRVIDEITLVNKTRTFVTWQSGYIAQIGDLYSFGNVTTTQGNPVYAVCIQGGTVNISIPPSIKSSGSAASYEIGYVSKSNDTQWRVIEIPETAPARSLIVDYKAGANNEFENALRNVDYLTVDAEGNLYAQYSNSSSLFYLTNIGGLAEDGIYLDDEGLNIVYTNGTTRFFELKQIDSITFQNQDNITQQQKFVIQYKDNTSQDVSSAINVILAVDRVGDNIVILYSDPVYRVSLQNSGVQGVDYYLKSWTDTTVTPNKTYNNLVWKNLGPLGAQYHVMGEYTYNDLKTTLINGFGAVTGLEDKAGWLVTVTDSSNNKHIYAYDYNGGTYTIGNAGDTFSSHWYEIMDLQTGNISPDLFVITDEDNGSGSPASYSPPFKEDMLWFVESYGHDTTY